MKSIIDRHADEIREMWQSRLLHESHGIMRKVVICALSKEFPQALKTLLVVTFPGFIDIERPIITSYAHVGKDGSIICDVIDRFGDKRKARVFASEGEFIYATRKLADGLKLNDADRTAMFGMLQKWVASDRRIGARGQRLAS